MKRDKKDFEITNRIIMFRRQKSRAVKEIQTHVVEYAEVIVKLAEELSKVFEASSNGDKEKVKVSWEKLAKLNKETDKREKDLLPTEGSISGVFSSVAIDQIHLIIYMEDLGDSIFELGRTISRMMLNELNAKKEMLEGVFKVLEEITFKTCAAVQILYEDYAKAFELTKEVEELRNKAREYEIDLIADYYERAKKLELKDWIFLSSLLKRIVGVAEAGEHATDYIELFALKH